MGDRQKQPLDKLKKGFSNLLKGRRPGAFTGKGHVLGSSDPSNQQQSNYSRPASNPRPQPIVPPKTPVTRKPPAPQPWQIQPDSTGANKGVDELAPMAEFNPYKAATISSTVLSSSANVPKSNSIAQSSQQHSDNQEQRYEQGQENGQAQSQFEIGYNAEALDIAIAMINSSDKAGDCFNLLGKLFRNIINNVSEMKFRKLRLSNPKIEENLINVAGGLELLQSAGFQIIEEEGTQYAILVLEADLAGVQRVLAFVDDQQNTTSNIDANLSASTDSLQTKDRQEQNQMQNIQQTYNDLPTNIQNRNTQVLLPVTPDTDVPDWFFERTPADIKREYIEAKRRREQGQILMTKALREKLFSGLQNNKNYVIAQVRVRFPEGVLLEGEFGVQEQCTNIYSWVEENLRTMGCTFDLILPNRLVLQQNRNVKQEDLAPQTLLNLKWTEQSALDMKNVVALKDELLQQAQFQRSM
eukprot:TRINITY_DN6054_c0_g1_i4.p1 TRINITY_DN6054_c0_g1~~TRINITY_DN6054_c0_g1_i4.p1  ORF type:complete len:469 (-),score=47.06 TRINITY_DN6054_c0_g1_i4:352-1758(-)